MTATARIEMRCEEREKDLLNRAAKRLPHHPIPTITLGRMGVEKQGQGKGVLRALWLRRIARAAGLRPELCFAGHP